MEPLVTIGLLALALGPLVGVGIGSVLPTLGKSAGELDPPRTLWPASVGVGIVTEVACLLIAAVYFTRGLGGQSALAGPGILLLFALGSGVVGLVTSALFQFALRLHQPDARSQPAIAAAERIDAPLDGVSWPVLVRCLQGIALLLAFGVLAQHAHPLVFLLLILSGLCFLHAYGIAHQQRWAHVASAGVSSLSVLAWIIGACCGIPGIIYLLTEGPWGQLAAIAIAAALLVSLLIVTVEIWLARAIHRRPADKAPDASATPTKPARTTEVVSDDILAYCDPPATHANQRARWLAAIAIVGVVLGILALTRVDRLTKLIRPPPVAKRAVRTPSPPPPRVSTVTPNRQSKPPTYPAKSRSERPVVAPGDLLNKAQLPRHVLRGNWTREPGKLLTSRGQPDTLILLANPPEEYDLELHFTRRVNNDGMFVGLVVQGQPCLLNVDGFPGHGYLSGLDLIDGQRIDNRANPTVVRGPQLTNDREQTLLCQVRGNRLVATLDGKRLVDWQGDPQRLSTPQLFRTPHPQTIYVGTWDAVYAFSRIQFQISSAAIQEPVGG